MIGLLSSASAKLGHGGMSAGSTIDAHGSGTTLGRCGSLGSHRTKNGRSASRAACSSAIARSAPQAIRVWSGSIGSISPQNPFVIGRGGSDCASRHLA